MGRARGRQLREVDREMAGGRARGIQNGQDCDHRRFDGVQLSRKCSDARLGTIRAGLFQRCRCRGQLGQKRAQHENIHKGRALEKALTEKPDFVLIQFGHNDSHATDRPEATSAAGDFRDYLRGYIDESRAAGATPILVTPMHRRTFDKDGKLTDILGPYAEAMKEVGAEKKVAVVDLHAASGKLFQQLGDAASAEMANQAGDRTHFNEKGARAMAELVMQELPTGAPPLKKFLR